VNDGLKVGAVDDGGDGEAWHVPKMKWRCLLSPAKLGYTYPIACQGVFSGIWTSYVSLGKMRGRLSVMAELRVVRQ